MKKLLIILLSIISLQLNAGIKYVAASGGNNGNAGTEAQPWATLAYGVANVSSGDTVYLLAGTHAISSQVSVPTGVNITGAGETSIISSSVTTTWAATLLLHSASQGTNGNQSISYLKFDGNETAWGAIQINARSNVEVHHCTFVDFFSCGTIFNANTTYAGPPSTYATGNKYYNNTSSNCSDYPTSDDGQGHIMFGGQVGMEIYNCDMTQTTRGTRRNGYLIKFYSYGYNKAFKIYNNTLTRSEDAPTDVYFDFAIETWHTQGGSEIYDNVMTGGIDVGGGITMNCLIRGDYEFGIKIYDNVIGGESISTQETGIYLERNTEGAIIERNIFKNMYNGIMFSPSSKEVVQDHEIRYNIFNSIEYYGIRFINGATGAFVDSVNIYNNVFYSPSGMSTLIGIGLLSVGTTTNLNVINNIIQGFDYAPMFANGAAGQTMDKINISNNLMYGNANGNEPLFSSLTPTNYTYANNVINDNPDFTTAGSDFTLQSVSPGRDAGLDVGLTTDFLEYAVPYNSVVDIGAYEYGSSPATPSDETDILTFVFSEQTGAATINSTTHTVSIEVEGGTNISELTPTITVSSGATIVPASGAEEDFSSPVTYTVTAEDEETDQEWTVTVTIEEEEDIILVTSIDIWNSSGARQKIDVNGGSVTFSYSAYPAEATDKTVTWTKIEGTGTGIFTLGAPPTLTAVTNGTVTIRATANDGSGVYDDMVITISNQTGEPEDPDPPVTRGFLKSGNSLLKHNGKFIK
jgi:hypothetical protein